MSEYAGQSQRVGHLERDRAEQFLQEAFAQGRIDEQEFEGRIDRALNARTRADLNGALTDLVPVTAPYMGAHPVYRPLARPGSVDVPGAKVAAGVAHLLPFVSWIVGPAIVYAISSSGSYTRREAAKAFNWTLVASGLFLGISILASIVGILEWMPALAFFAWAALSVVGAVKAFGGENWTNPLMRVIPIRVLSER